MKVMTLEDFCNTGCLDLDLGLGCSIDHQTPKTIHFDHHLQQKKQPPYLKFDHQIFPCLTLGLSSSSDVKNPELSTNTNLYRQGSSATAGSSFSISSVKREREIISGDQEGDESEKVISKATDHDQEDQDGCGRKKLRLTKDQSLILEDNFREHSTLNPKQKQALAKQLNLRPRQIEVWFQNRRARTKLKKTEVDCELLKKCCEALAHENRRLQKELQQLKALKLAAAPCYMQLPAAALSMCPSCERLSSSNNPVENKTKSPFSVATKPV